MTDLTAAERREFAILARELPFTMNHRPPYAPVTTTSTLLAWLDSYTQHAIAEERKLREEARENARAAQNLRALRSALANTTAALDELDARHEREHEHEWTFAGTCDTLGCRARIDGEL